MAISYYGYFHHDHQRPGHDVLLLHGGRNHLRDDHHQDRDDLRHDSYSAARDPAALARAVAPLRESPWAPLAVVAIFLYVGAEVSIGSFMISYLSMPGIGAISENAASGYVSLYWGGAMVGRFVGFALSRRFAQLFAAQQRREWAPLVGVGPAPADLAGQTDRGIAIQPPVQGFFPIAIGRGTPPALLLVGLAAGDRDPPSRTGADEFQHVMVLRIFPELQPGLEDRARLLKLGVHEERFVRGLISLVSFATPLRPDDALPPGYAYWLPPLSPFAFDGPDALVETVVTTLKRGDLPAVHRHGRRRAGWS